MSRNVWALTPSAGASGRGRRREPHATPSYAGMIRSRRPARAAQTDPRSSSLAAGGWRIEAAYFLPGANLAATTAALLVALPLAAGEPVDAAAVAALAIVAPATLTLVGLSISLALACALLGASSPRELIRATRVLAWRAGPATRTRGDRTHLVRHALRSPVKTL